MIRIGAPAQHPGASPNPRIWLRVSGRSVIRRLENAELQSQSRSLDRNVTDELDQPPVWIVSEGGVIVRMDLR
jgi:hypothetical protein